MAYTYRNPHQQSLLAAQQELQQRLQERERINLRIVELEEAIRYLTPLAENAQGAISDPLPHLCLKVLGLSFNDMAVPQIRDGLRLMGIEIQGPNPMAILHTALGRLATNGYVDKVPSYPGGPTHYRITTAGRLASQQ